MTTDHLSIVHRPVVFLFPIMCRAWLTFVGCAVQFLVAFHACALRAPSSGESAESWLINARRPLVIAVASEIDVLYRCTAVRIHVWIRVKAAVLILPDGSSRTIVWQ